jgi:hypothetical protein
VDAADEVGSHKDTEGRGEPTEEELGPGGLQ